MAATTVDDIVAQLHAPVWELMQAGRMGDALDLMEQHLPAFLAASGQTDDTTSNDEGGA